MNIMGSLMNSLREYFGNDKFNSNNSTKLDLSKMIYILYKIVKHIDDNTNFYDELVDIYSKYNIVLSKSNYDINNVEEILSLKKEIEELSNYNLGEFIKNIDKGNIEKNELINIENKIKTINNISKKIVVKQRKSKYKHFSARKRYTEFTGINSKFFDNIK